METECEPKSDRHVKRNFLNSETKIIIEKLHKENMTTEQIANFLNIRKRQVRDYINRLKLGQCNQWSDVDDRQLVYLYSEGIEKPSLLRKFFTNKTDWMIRNRIKMLKKQRRIIDDTITQTVSSPNTCEITAEDYFHIPTKKGKNTV